MQVNPDLPPLLVRADADARQGIGHVMRSLALAREWRSRGGPVRFVTARPTPELSRRIQLAGAILIGIEQPYPHAADLDSVVALLGQLQRGASSPPWVVLDGYHFDASYQSRVRHAGCQLLVIDDNAQLPRYDADIVLNHGIQAPRFDYRINDDAWFLLGTRYALLRPEFLRWRDFHRRVETTAKNVLVTLGGGDADNVSAKILNGLRRLRDLDLEVQVLAGPLNPHREELCKLVSASPEIHLQKNVADTAPLMAWADIAIAAGGTTAWELAFMQVPALLVVLEDNQRSGVEGIDQFGAAQSLGGADHLTAAMLDDALRVLIRDRDRRQRMAVHGRILVDGMGPQRVVSAMEERQRSFSTDDFYLRPASEDDQLLLWQWANDPVARRNSFHNQVIGWESHQAWCVEKLASPDCRIWIMQIGALPVGQIRYERINRDTAEISLSIARGFRGRHLGTRLLEASGEQALRELGVRLLQGAVRIDNEASRRAFLKAGFECRKQETTDGIACWVFRRSAQGSSWRVDHVAVH